MRKLTISLYRCLLRQFVLPGMLTGIYLLLIAFFLRHYIISDTITLAGILSAPYLLRFDSRSPGRYRYFVIAFLMLLLTWATGIATFYFFALGFAMLFVVESMAGRTNWLPVFLMGMICPAFKYFNNIFGFHVRLKLSEIAGTIMNAAGLGVQVEGNIMVMGGFEYSVDPACVGLKMMAVSLLGGLLMMAFFERRYNRSFTFLQVMTVMAILVLLNVTGNLFRIIVLVVFHILPDNPAHDLVGILCLCAYVFIPAYFTVKFLAKYTRCGCHVNSDTGSNGVFTLNVLLLIVASGAGLKISQVPPSESKELVHCIQGDYTKCELSNDVIKYEKAGILIYVKPVKRFYGTDHNPMICWRGSGYEFRRINRKVVEGCEIFTGTLEKGSDVIYSAWWYDNGEHATISQFDWRWKAFKGEVFSLVNVNSASEKVLNEEVRKILKKDKDPGF